MLKLKRTISMLVILLTFSHVTLTSYAASSVNSAGLTGKIIATSGNNKGATPCISCHGVNGGGQAQAGFPRLAGLNPRYMEKQLHDFTTDRRNNPIMSPIAGALSDTEIKAVVDYFASLPPSSAADKSTALPDTLPSSASKLIKEGQLLAENGDWPNNIPACFACHGNAANGIGEHFPALASQHASYLTNQIKAWQSGQRNNDPNQLMKSVAMRLSETQIKAVSAYLASPGVSSVTSNKSTSSAQ